MRNFTVPQDFKQNQMLARFYEVEALIYLLRTHIESQYNDSDLTLIHGFRLLSDGALMDLYKTITLNTDQPHQGGNDETY